MMLYKEEHLYLCWLVRSVKLTRLLWTGHIVWRMGEINAFRILVGKVLGRQWRKRENNIKVDFREVGFIKMKGVWSWSQWPSGLRNELSSLPWTPDPWVRIPLRVWMFSVCVVCTFVCVCVCDELITRLRSPIDCPKSSN
jgi:hypothetical protein